MAAYKLSLRAEAQLLEIEEYTASKFGEYQADAYITGFQQSFELAQFSLIGRSADELRQGCRRYRYQVHHIFYTLEVDHVLIRAILHAAQDLRGELFD